MTRRELLAALVVAVALVVVAVWSLVGAWGLLACGVTLGVVALLIPEAKE